MTAEDMPNERTRLIPEFRLRSSSEEALCRKDASIIGWDGKKDTTNPKNWSTVKKWSCAMIVSTTSIISPTASSMVVPAMPAIARDLNITSTSIAQLTLSIYILGWALGPLYIAPLSEIYGRALVLHVAQFGFLIFNTLCILTTDQGIFLGLRFISGLLGSGPLSLGPGILADLWVSDERGKSLALYSAMTLLGPTVGPLLGGYVVQKHSWRYIFSICSIVTSILLVYGMLFLEETFGPVILRRKRAALVKAGAFSAHITSWEEKNKFRKILTVDLVRPFVLLATQPIIQCLALYMGFLFGLNQLTISTFHTLWRDIYHESEFVSSFNYMSITIGFLAGCQTGGFVNDRIYAYLKRRNNNIDLPEYRVWLMIPSTVLVPSGLLLYGWSAANALHWLLPNVGIAIYAFGLLMGYQCIQAYVLDAYPVYAASAMGALTVLRAVAGFVLPIFAPAAYKALGYGWASTAIAGAALSVGTLAIWLLKAKGAELREKSPYAAGDVDVVLGQDA